VDNPARLRLRNIRAGGIACLTEDRKILIKQEGIRGGRGNGETMVILPQVQG